MHCWARYLFIAVIAVLGIGQMVAACGQKGDLYLPEPETEKASPAAEQPDPVPAPEPGAESAAKADAS